MHKLLIQNKDVNWLLVVPAWIMLYSVMYLILSLLGWVNNFTKVIAFLASAFMVYSTLTKVPPLQRAKLLFFGEEAGENDNGIWLDPGYYFLYGFWSLLIEETVKTEKKSVLIPPFNCQDKNGKKILVGMNGNWEVGTDPGDEENYMLMDAKEMPIILTTLLNRTAIRVLGRKDYWKDMIGKELHDDLLNDTTFKNEIKSFGIKWKSLIIEVTSGNLDQDNLNAYREELTSKFQTLYPGLTPSELADRVEVQLKIAKKVIASREANLLFRANIDD